MLLTSSSSSPLRAGACAIAVVVVLTAQGLSAQGTSATPETLARDGQRAMAAGRYREAFDAFYLAVQQRPRDPSLYAAAAQAAALLGQPADAERWLERALRVEPSYVPASRLLADVLYGQGRTREAIDVLERAHRLAPDDRDLARQLDEWRAGDRLERQFFETRSAHFTVRFEGPADQATARDVIDALESAYTRISAALLAYPRERLAVVLYTQQQFRDVTRVPSWASGVYDGRIHLPVRGAADRRDVMRRVAEHELTHALVTAVAGPSVPAWMQEGLAIAFESDTPALEALTPSTTVPLSQLAGSFASLSRVQADVAYAQSALAVKRMIALRGMPAVAALLRDVGRGVPWDQAFERSLSMRVEAFERSLSSR